MEEGSDLLGCEETRGRFGIESKDTEAGTHSQWRNRSQLNVILIYFTIGAQHPVHHIFRKENAYFAKAGRKKKQGISLRTQLEAKFKSGTLH